MYYSNMANEELQQFHGFKAKNFTATLTQILISPLFTVEDIIEDTLYRIYPLFYTGTITSSNPDAKILENKCIICNKTTAETYFTFISDETQPLEEYNYFGTSYTIGDSLTLQQFNAYISLLRQNVIHNEKIAITDTFNGEYGDYLFNVEDANVVDNGLIISDETITADPQVKLTNPIFKNSNYILKLNVLHYEGVNILEDITDEFKVVDTLEIPLKTDEWVKIPITTIKEDYIIELTGTVTINHKKNIIQNSPQDITLTTDKNILSNHHEDTCILTAKYISLDCEGQTVIFKANGTLIGTGVTDENGIATYTYTSTGQGDIVFSAECNNNVVTCNVEDCLYWNADESVLSTRNTSLLYDDELSIGLPSNCLISYDMAATNVSQSSERRFFLIPRQQFSTGTTQGSDVLFSQISSGKITLATRENGVNSPGVDASSIIDDQYSRIKYVRDGDSVQRYVDDTYIDTITYSLIANYNDWTFSQTRWNATGESKIRNVKIKKV